MARLTAGLATGAPLSACKKMKPRHPWPPQSDKSIYDVVFEAKHYIPGKTVNVTIIGGRYRGFMLQARKTNTRITFGRWKDPPKFSKLLKCFNKEGTAVTHTHASNAVVNGTYEWIVPETLCIPSITFEATVAQFLSVYWRALESPPLPRGPSVNCVRGFSSSGKLTYRINIMIVTLCFHLVTRSNYIGM
uniref:Putative defense protein n=2 Tax=Callorhinchus milii TaxID=7868 RepID=A0A4W3J253_CALMI|eukprot:gi/632935813/ref/XP_007891358.1/ PREDICTED: putative defense protein isoform X1 [Callorhinchus milii]